jgi:uncharacterized protein YdeI (YjbR/CyaY-like superfamily)
VVSGVPNAYVLEDSQSSDTMNNTNVESYLRDGCGRCSRFQTPECKVHLWTDALSALRGLLLESELVEQMKWGSPCYTLDGKNVVMLASFNEFCSLSFFKGAALGDEDLLVKPGPNSRYARRVEFTSLEDVVERRSDLLRILEAAIEFERSGEEFEPDDALEPMPVELEERLAVDEDLRLAFESLTPGRQRSHILYVSGAKKAQTRVNRAERCVPKILAGKGYNER